MPAVSVPLTTTIVASAPASPVREWPSTTVTFGRLSTGRGTAASTTTPRTALLLIVRELLGKFRRFNVVLPAGIGTLVFHQVGQDDELGVFGLGRAVHWSSDGYSLADHFLAGVEQHAVHWSRHLADHVEYLAQRALSLLEEQHGIEI